MRKSIVLTVQVIMTSKKLSSSHWNKVEHHIRKNATLISEQTMIVFITYKNIFLSPRCILSFKLSVLFLQLISKFEKAFKKSSYKMFASFQPWPTSIFCILNFETLRNSCSFRNFSVKSGKSRHEKKLTCWSYIAT